MNAILSLPWLRDAQINDVAKLDSLLNSKKLHEWGRMRDLSVNQVTGDKRLFNAVGPVLSWVKWLGDYQFDTIPAPDPAMPESPEA